MQGLFKAINGSSHGRFSGLNSVLSSYLFWRLLVSAVRNAQIAQLGWGQKSIYKFYCARSFLGGENAVFGAQEDQRIIPIKPPTISPLRRAKAELEHTSMPDKEQTWSSCHLASMLRPREYPKMAPSAEPTRVRVVWRK